VRPHFVEEDPDEAEKLHALKEKMRQTHMQVLQDLRTESREIFKLY
jgi:hypothetical protein